MLFRQISAKGDRNFAYLIADEAAREAAIADPSYAPEVALAQAQQHNLKIRFVISTHSHPDHVAGNEYISERTGAAVVMHESTSHPCDLRVKDEQNLPLGAIELRFLHTPGHIPDHICVQAGNNLLTGDLLFVGKVGGTGDRFPGSDPRQQWDSLQRLMKLPPTLEIWPGHDYGDAPSSTIEREIATNPFLKSKTYDDFLYLKNHWAEYKQAHNIR